MAGVWHFETLRRELGMIGWEQGHQTLTIRREGLMNALRPLLEKQPFDEAWYLKTYPDVAIAVRNGIVNSGREHYLSFGYFEGRLPGLSGFDVQIYCSNNPDLKPLLDQPGGEEKIRRHFIHHGYREGRSAD